MKTFKKVVGFFTGSNKSQKKSKKDVNIPYNSTLVFQMGLVVSVSVVALIVNSSFSEIKDYSDRQPEIHESEEIYFHSYTIIQPEVKPEIPEEPKPQKKIIKDKIIIDNTTPDIKGDDPVVDPEPVEVPIDSRPVAPPITDKKEEPANYSVMGVERVPVFPGCEYLTENVERRECMSSEIGQIIRRRFDTSIASDIGLKGNQRIYVNFIINKDGQVEDVKVRAPHPKLEMEAKRVINMIPTMLPGMQNNKDVAVMFNLPIIIDVKDY